MYYVHKPDKPRFSRLMIAYLLILNGSILYLIFFIANVGTILERILSFLPVMFFLSVIPLLIYLLFYFAKVSDYNLSQKNFAEYEARKIAEYKAAEKIEQKKQAELIREYNEAVESQRSTVPWAVRYATSPCPHCGHYKVRNANWEDKRLSVAFWGAASNAIGKSFKCEHCGKMW